VWTTDRPALVLESYLAQVRSISLDTQQYLFILLLQHAWAKYVEFLAIHKQIKHTFIDNQLAS
jgi:hypothetical protein